jgi:hypothetical protein
MRLKEKENVKSCELRAKCKVVYNRMKAVDSSVLYFIAAVPLDFIQRRPFVFPVTVSVIFVCRITEAVLSYCKWTSNWTCIQTAGHFGTRLFIFVFYQKKCSFLLCAP